VVALAAGLAAAGCSAGQITQTDAQVAAVNGASGTVGTIAVRDAQLLFPAENKYYAEGDNAPLVVTIINSGTSADKLLGVTSDASEPAGTEGDVDLEPGTSIASLGDQDDAGSHPASSSAPSSVTATSTPSGAAATTTTTTPPSGAATTTTTTTPPSSVSGSASAPSSVSPTSSSVPAVPGKVKITLKKLAKELRPGHTIKVTFLFEKAGPLTLELPIGADPEPRAEHAAEH
jgi:copper(I)-binding protein